MAIEVPLFPLGAVLFPHMRMSLHIFEARYRAMIRDCRAASTTFGIVAIRTGFEVGRGAIPYEVGTLAPDHVACVGGASRVGRCIAIGRRIGGVDDIDVPGP